jgi:hypothetical protein
MTVNRPILHGLARFASQESAFDLTSAGLPARFESAVAINPVIAHPMLSRGSEVANRTNFVAVHESGNCRRISCWRLPEIPDVTVREASELRLTSVMGQKGEVLLRTSGCPLSPPSGPGKETIFQNPILSRFVRRC